MNYRAIGMAIRIVRLGSPRAKGEGKEALNAEDEKEWKEFRRKFLAEMKGSEASKDLDLLSAMSHQTDFSIGCYCEDESRCHRSILRELLVGRGAELRSG